MTSDAGGSTKDTAPAPDTASLLRLGVLGLAALGIAGTAIELVFLRHWSSATQLVVWPVLIALTVAVVALLRRPSGRTVRWVRVIAAVVVVVAALGVAIHVNANLEAGPLDRDYASRWVGLPMLRQLWLATTGGVGPAPALAPGAIAEIALALLVATIRHPALAQAGPRDPA